MCKTFLPANNSAKIIKIVNRSRFSRVMITNVLPPFYGSQCSLMTGSAVLTQCTDVMDRTITAIAVALISFALWRSYTVSCLNKFRACYNRCVKLFFRYKRRDSLTRAIFETGLPSFDTVMCNAAYVVTKSVSLCSNAIVGFLRGLCLQRTVLCACVCA